jgi:hypothetical protein
MNAFFLDILNNPTHIDSKLKSTKQIIISRDVTFDETLVFSPHKDIHVEPFNQMHDLLLDQNFLKSFTYLPNPISSITIPNLPSPIQPMNSSPNHITPINSTDSLIKFDDFPSPSNHVLNQNLKIIEEFSRLSNNDNQNEVHFMLGILTTHERNHLRQNPKRTQRVIKKPNRFIKTIQAKLTPNISKHSHALFHQSFQIQNPPHIRKPLMGQMLQIEKRPSN